MKKIIWLQTLLIVCLISANGETHTITNSEFSFIPNNLTINLGDTINFVLTSIHNAVEVSEATWNVNGNTSNGGFSTPFGGGIVVIQSVGTYYYVCTPHAFLGMKGLINVNPATNVKEENQEVSSSFKLVQNFPNPFNQTTTISFSISNKSSITLKIFNVLGQIVDVLLSKKEMNSGYHSIGFDADKLSSGVYFYRLTVEGVSGEPDANRYTEQRKMLLLK